MAVEFSSSGAQRDAIDEKKVRVRKCLDVLDRYTILTLSSDAFEEFEENLQGKEREAFGAKAVLSDFLDAMAVILQWHDLDPEIGTWLKEKIAEFEHVLAAEDRPTLDDLKTVTLIVRELLDRMYDGETIQKIRQEVIPTKAVESKELNIEAEKEEYARKLYTARYEDQYYPEVSTLLGLNGDKKKDEKIIDETEKRLEAKFWKGSWEKTLPLLQNIMLGEDEHGDARLYLMLSTNKMRTKWFHGFLGDIDNLVALGVPIEDLYQAANKLTDEVKRKRAVLSKAEIARYKQEGKRTQNFSLKAPVTQEDIKKADALIDRVFMVLYPQVVEIDDYGVKRVNQEKLEEALGIKKA